MLPIFNDNLIDFIMACANTLCHSNEQNLRTFHKIVEPLGIERIHK